MTLYTPIDAQRPEERFYLNRSFNYRRLCK
jgi:hypothetical protein